MPLDPPPHDPPVWWLASSWLRVRCACGRSAALSSRLLPYERYDLALVACVDRLRCKSCGGRPYEVFLADRPDTFGPGGPRLGRRVWLVRTER